MVTVSAYVEALKTIMRPTLGGIAPRLAWSASKIEAHYKMGREDREDEWMYMFADLSCVVIFYNVCYIVFNCGFSRGNLAAINVMLVAVFNVRLSFDEYINRFALKFDKLNYFQFSTGMFFMSLNAFAFKYSQNTNSNSSGYTCSSTGEQYFIGFSIGYLLCKTGIILIIFRLLLIDQKCREQFMLDFIRHVLVTVVLIIGVIGVAVDPQHHSNAEKLQYWAGLMVFEFLFSAYNAYLHAIVAEKVSFGMWFGKERYIKIGYHYPLDIYRHQSRLGLFVMMILGEVMLEMGLASYSLNSMFNIDYFDFFVLVLAYSFAVQYYDCVHRPPGKVHAMQRSVKNGFLFTWLHPVLGYCMLLMIVATTKMYTALHTSGSVDVKYRQMLAASCALTCGLIAFGRLLHKGSRNAIRSPVHVVRLLFIGLHVLVLTSTMNYKYDVVMHACIAGMLATVDIIDNRVKEALEWDEMSRRFTHTSVSSVVGSNFLLLNSVKTGYKFHTDVPIPHHHDNNDQHHLPHTLSTDAVVHTELSRVNNPVYDFHDIESGIGTGGGNVSVDSTDSSAMSTNKSTHHSNPDPYAFTLHHGISFTDAAYRKRFPNIDLNQH